MFPYLDWIPDATGFRELDAGFMELSAEPRKANVCLEFSSGYDLVLRDDFTTHARELAPLLTVLRAAGAVPFQQVRRYQQSDQVRIRGVPKVYSLHVLRLFVPAEVDVDSLFVGNELDRIAQGVHALVYQKEPLIHPRPECQWFRLRLEQQLAGPQTRL